MEIDVGKSLANNSRVIAPWSFSKGQTNKLASKHSSSNPIFKQSYGENRHFVKPDTKRPATSSYIHQQHLYSQQHMYFFVSDYCWSVTILNSYACTGFLCAWHKNTCLGIIKLEVDSGGKSSEHLEDSNQWRLTGFPTFKN